MIIDLFCPNQFHKAFLILKINVEKKERKKYALSEIIYNERNRKRKVNYISGKMRKPIFKVIIIIFWR